MSIKLPFFQFYPTLWLTDSVAGCSLAAQGLWLRLLFLMHNSERYGYLSQGGSPIPADRVCRSIGCSLPEYETLLEELVKADVPSFTSKGIMYSRRMTKDQDVRLENRARKAKSRSNHKKTLSDGHSDVTAVSQRCHREKLEVRSYKSEAAASEGIGAPRATPAESPPLTNTPKPPEPAARDVSGFARPRGVPERYRPEAITAVAQMLTDWLDGRLGPPDEEICQTLLTILGGDTDEHLERLAEWFRGLRRRGKHPSQIQTYGWFARVLAADMTQMAAI